MASLSQRKKTLELDSAYRQDMPHKFFETTSSDLQLFHAV